MLPLGLPLLDANGAIAKANATGVGQLEFNDDGSITGVDSDGNPVQVGWWKDPNAGVQGPPDSFIPDAVRSGKPRLTPDGQVTASPPLIAGPFGPGLNPLNRTVATLPSGSNIALWMILLAIAAVLLVMDGSGSSRR